MNTQELVTAGKKKKRHGMISGEQFEKPVKSNKKYPCNDFIVYCLIIYILILFLGGTSPLIHTPI